jgi:ssDNA-binding Zn-finger/Zn-ribbon topoisomerase 1
MTGVPACPDCGATMVRRVAGRGVRVGKPFWGCSRYPTCYGNRNIDDLPRDSAAPVQQGQPAVYAQRRFEEERRRERIKRRAMLPLVVAVALIGMTGMFLATIGFGVTIASLMAVASGFVGAWCLFRLPADSLFWAKGIEGERRAADQLEPLLAKGYIVLYGRLIPGVNADIDSLVIGPAGVFVIETKNWSGKINVTNNKIFVGDRDRSNVVEQVYRNAIATQIALGDELTPARLTVVPVLCAIGGTSSSGFGSGVHIVDGGGLSKLISDRPALLDEEQVARLARLADARLRVPYEWESR